MRPCCWIWAGLLLAVGTQAGEPQSGSAEHAPWGWAGDGSPKPLGRLFYTPEQRMRLEASSGDEAAAEREYTLNGIVRRSSGRSTAWLNGQAYHDGREREGILLLLSPREPGSAVLIPPKTKTALPLSVGQSVTSTTGETRGLAARPAAPRRR